MKLLVRRPLIKQKFLRFPGGNNLEGLTVPTRWKWNETIGPLKDRPGRPTPWSYEETGGMGLVEYMNWADDLDLEPSELPQLAEPTQLTPPVVAVYDGLSLDGHPVSECELEPYVQDALDELEFLTGSADTKFGALRASVGHPEPWRVKYVEVGNEDDLSNGLSSYKSYRFQAFYDAIKGKYPDMEVLASTLKLDLPGDAGGDYHLYAIPDDLVAEYNYFDQMSPKHSILLGECLQSKVEHVLMV